MSRNEAVVLLLNVAFDTASMKMTNEERADGIGLLATLRRDPLIKTTMALRAATMQQSLFGIDTSSSARRGPLERLMSNVYGKYINSNDGNNIGDSLTDLVNLCEQNYSALSALCRSQRVPTDLHHMKRYIKGWQDIDGLPTYDIPPKLADNARVTQLVEIFDDFVDRLVSGDYNLDTLNKAAA